MPWWITLYLTIISMLAIASSIEEKRMGLSWLHITLSILSLLIVITGVISYYDDRVASYCGRLLLPFVVVSLVWELYAGNVELKKLKPFEDMSESENTHIRTLAIIFSVLILSPGYIISFIAGYRLW